MTDTAAPSVPPVAPDPVPATAATEWRCFHTDVYEIVDRLTGKRASEVVYMTALDAMNQLEAWAEKYGPKVEKSYRVQGVKVYGT